MALLWKMICNLGDPMSLRHPVSALRLLTKEPEIKACCINTMATAGVGFTHMNESCHTYT